MSAYISTDLNMIKELDPQRHELALQMAEFLEKGGTIEVLQGPSFKPQPVRHEPLAAAKVKQPKPAAPVIADAPYMDKITQREIGREDRAEQRAIERAELIERLRGAAVTMTYAQAVLRLGMSRRNLQKLAVENGFKFKREVPSRRQAYLRGPDSEDRHAKDAERIKAFKEIGLSRNQAALQLGVTFRTFNLLLDKFAIDYPKRKAGPHPAFFAKQQ
ncbi:hypothetical protein BK660_21705 [Pseudomonas brassicacearum]|uniref:Uncharacterized protein n=1 Tax=Pseudomonas brassicacearum TaxID=930166 RepID=A0A423HXG7_9PSED|nr:hypothetical protein [Pseudomonas brassicacearum]RON17909.1 hypothetical protein BK660_21705 [Pseudomonas brassicacearum]